MLRVCLCVCGVPTKPLKSFNNILRFFFFFYRMNELTFGEIFPPYLNPTLVFLSPSVFFWQKLVQKKKKKKKEQRVILGSDGMLAKLGTFHDRGELLLKGPSHWPPWETFVMEE